MSDFIFLVFNTVIFGLYYHRLRLWGITRSTEKFFFAFLLTVVQIISILLFLGAVGLLRPYPAVIFNMGAIIILAFWPPLPTPNKFSRGLQFTAWQEIIRPLSNKIIAILGIIVFFWLLISSYFLPPRTADDIIYHLPVIYESIQRGRWFLLPTDLRPHFAYPMNAEVFYAWPVLFLNDTRWVDAMQIPIGLWTSLGIFLFGRHLGLRRQKVFFLAGLFFLTPIVIAQMGTNYIDIFSAGFLLCSLYTMSRFLLTGKKIYVFFCSLAIGTMMGMKYHLLFWGIVLTLILSIILWRKKHLTLLAGVLLAVAGLGLFWHIRNAWVFSDWLYPVHATAPRWDMITSVKMMLLSLPEKMGNIFMDRNYIGTVDGGFGFCYGFIVLLSWVLTGFYFLARKKRWERGEFILWAVVCSFIILLLPIGNNEFMWVGRRLTLAVWPILILTFGRTVFILIHNVKLHKLVIFLCLAGIAWDIPSLVSSPMPHHHLSKNIQHSEFEGLRDASWFIVDLSPCASALDIMTRSLSRPSTAFLAMPDRQFLIAPFYGRYLQTRIINFDPKFQGDPDFLVYLTAWSNPIIYIGKYKKTLSEALTSDYKEIFWDRSGRIFIHPRILKNLQLKANSL